MMVQQGARLQSPHSAAVAALYPGAAAAAAAAPRTRPAAVVPQTVTVPATTTATATSPTHAGSKRKADAQDNNNNNERLSKRLSLLNLEQNGSKLYVPVESAAHRLPPAASVIGNNNSGNGNNGDAHVGDQDDDVMHVDDTKHKVYIYNMDDELSSSSDNESDDGRLVFLPDIEKHLRQNRIPPHVLVNSDGELAGMQMVLYSDPKSLSVPEEKDGVRKAIIEARHRVRERQRLERECATMIDDGPVAGTPALQVDTTQSAAADSDYDDDAMDMD
ncbi:hypothetical protein JDV02_009366 [Purpureocillium takamizusanense]|uniref:Uncharacterized protein n=1 Tax=Purpureocillium takamizusanense TaxID=2060973 RepID=A0A9Q8QRR3_9HYPO|nr:uncharacterized protein JDV02_009366 [Purpureocillium takamizusanense]UNI23549.1 hypothetical protein JDV02_009366 [Purpureocillium takamizusanense]